MRECCDSGGAYRFTIQPVFENIKTEHQCHIKRHRPSPETLYELFYNVQLPSTGFETTVVHRKIHRSPNDERRGRQGVDFLLVEHDAGLDLEVWPRKSSAFYVTLRYAAYAVQGTAGARRRHRRPHCKTRCRTLRSTDSVMPFSRVCPCTALEFISRVV